MWQEELKLERKKKQNKEKNKKNSICPGTIVCTCVWETANYYECLVCLQAAVRDGGVPGKVLQLHEGRGGSASVWHGV